MTANNYFHHQIVGFLVFISVPSIKLGTNGLFKIAGG